MGRRYRIRNAYVVRDKKGRFKNWTSIGKSIARDRKTQAKAVKKGYGHQGDIPKKLKKGYGKKYSGESQLL